MGEWSVARNVSVLPNTLVSVFGGSLSRGLLKLHQTGGKMLLIDRVAQKNMN